MTTARDLLNHQMAEAGRMLDIVLSGFSEETADHRVGNLKNAREQVVHLCHCYQAASDRAAGKPLAWGEYSTAATDWPGLLAEMKARREEAVGCFASDDPDLVHHGSDFMVGHEHYHIGQLCALRFDFEPDWDPYAIYG